MTSVCDKKCRIKFETALKFDPSQEKQITQGMPHQMAGGVKFYGNQ